MKQVRGFELKPGHILEFGRQRPPLHFGLVLAADIAYFKNPDTPVSEKFAKDGRDTGEKSAQIEENLVSRVKSYSGARTETFKIDWYSSPDFGNIDCWLGSENLVSVYTEITKQIVGGGLADVFASANEEDDEVARTVYFQLENRVSYLESCGHRVSFFCSPRVHISPAQIRVYGKNIRPLLWYGTSNADTLHRLQKISLAAAEEGLLREKNEKIRRHFL